MTITPEIRLARQFLGPLLLVLVLAACAPTQADSTSESAPTQTQTETAGVEEAEENPPTATPQEAARSAEEDEAETMTGEFHPDSGQTVYQMLQLEDGATLQYAVVLPEKFDPSQEHPVLLAFPPGPQTRAMVDAGLDSYWAREAKARGWVILSPVAPQGILFFRGSEIYIPEFLERMAELYRPEGGRYHLGGISNGGLSAFRVALQHPDRFHSLVVLPGFPFTEEEFEQLGSLADIPVAMFVGEQDTTWLEAMQQTEKALSGLGGQVSLEVVPDEGHVIQALTGGEELFDLLDSFRP